MLYANWIFGCMWPKSMNIWIQVTKGHEKRLDVFLHSCLRRIFKIYWPEKISNINLRERAEMDKITVFVKLGLGIFWERIQTTVEQLWHGHPKGEWKEVDQRKREEDSRKRKNATRVCKLDRNSQSCTRQDQLEDACSMPYSPGGEKE